MSDTLIASRGGVSEETLLQLPDPLSASFVPHQEPLAANLDSPAIAALALASIPALHFTGPLYSAVLLASSALLVLIHHDYRNFLNLGHGGVPSTPRGYLRVAWLRLFALRDPFSPPRLTTPTTQKPQSGLLPGRNLPQRPGPRPRVAGIIPHRQLDQRGPDAPHLSLHSTVQNLASARPQSFYIARSCLEKHGAALFARRPVNETCRGEVLHIHASDRSMHMDLHPEDIAEVLEKGWGERHPLAKRGMPVKETFVMIYAPRDDDDLRIVCRIIEAAIWFVTAEETNLDVI